MAKKNNPDKKELKFTEDESSMPLGKKNYYYIAAGVVVLIIGFLLLAGGASDDPEVFNPDIFSFRRMYIAPVVIVAGFVFIIWAIMTKTKEK